MSDVAPSNKGTTGVSTVGAPLAVAELAGRCMGNVAIVAMVLDKFEKQLSVDTQALEEGMAARDAARLAQIAHALKGAAGAVAATTLGDLAGEVERLARQDRLESIACELSRLRVEIERCVGYLPTARKALACDPPTKLDEKGESR